MRLLANAAVHHGTSRWVNRYLSGDKQQSVELHRLGQW